MFRKVIDFGQSGCILAKWLYSGKMFVFGQKWLFSGQVVILGKNSCIWENVIVFGKNSFTRAR